MGSHQVLVNLEVLWPPRGGEEVKGQGIDSRKPLGLQASHLAPSTLGTIPHTSSLTLGSPFAPGQLTKPGRSPSFLPITLSSNKRMLAMADTHLFMDSTVYP